MKRLYFLFCLVLCAISTAVYLQAQAPVGIIGGFASITAPTFTGPVTVSSGGLAVTGTISGDTIMTLGTNPGGSGTVRLPNTGSIVDRNAANNGDLGIFDTTAANIMRIAYTGITTIQTGATSIQVGGNTSSFPMLKRVTTTISVRLADDTADAAIVSSDHTLTNQKATTGQRFACLDTAGKIVSSVSACSGT